MSRFFHQLPALLIVGCLSVPAVGQSAPNDTAAKPPVSAFGSLPLVSQVRLSADGRYLAMLQTFQGKPVAVIMQPFDPGTKPAVVTGDDMMIAGLMWTRNNRLILLAKSNTQIKYDTRIRTWVRSVAVDPDGKNAAILLNNAPLGLNMSSAGILDVNSDDPNHIVMALYTLRGEDSNHSVHVRGDDTPKYFKQVLYRVDTTTGEGTVFAEGTSNTAGWMTDGRGNPIIRIDQTVEPLEDHLYLMRGGRWIEVAKFDASGDKGTDLAGLYKDGKTLLFTKRNDKTLDGLVLRTYEDDGRIDEKPLFYAPLNDVDDVVTDPWTGLAIGARYTDDETQSVYFDPEIQSLQKGLESAFPGKVAIPTSWDTARNRFVIVVEGPRTPPIYYLFDRAANRLFPIAQSYPQLKEADLGEMKPYPFKARDGLDIHAYITLPPGKAPKNLPAIVMPHGGPDARDEMRFDWWAQFLANRGYVVLQPNFRGSAGYGKAFTEKGLKHWGQEMQDDVTDGVKKMIADGIADPKRICIVGASYGGYATLAGVTFSPDLYACGASWAGVSDLGHILVTERKDHGARSQVLSFWQTRIGDINKDQDRINATSPALHADQVKCPVLLMHGEGDTTVRIDQSEIEDAALRRAGKKVEFVRFQGSKDYIEDHYLGLPETRIKMLTLLEKFLKDNIGD
jgi:dipeptidyl aminopeptidase/acylaminoacyl peptidase